MTSSDKNNVILGFITYGKLTAKYLPYFLSSLKKQTHENFRIMAVDNSKEKDNDNAKLVKEKISGDKNGVGRR